MLGYLHCGGPENGLPITPWATADSFGTMLFELLSMMHKHPRLFLNYGPSLGLMANLCHKVQNFAFCGVSWIAAYRLLLATTGAESAQMHLYRNRCLDCLALAF